MTSELVVRVLIEHCDKPGNSRTMRARVNLLLLRLLRSSREGHRCHWARVCEALKERALRHGRPRKVG